MRGKGMKDEGPGASGGVSTGREREPAVALSMCAFKVPACLCVSRDSEVLSHWGAFGERRCAHATAHANAHGNAKRKCDCDCDCDCGWDCV
jgi:hypothetical protein